MWNLQLVRNMKIHQGVKPLNRHIHDLNMKDKKNLIKDQHDIILTTILMYLFQNNYLCHIFI